MNILYDHQIFALQQYGGISRYFYELIKLAGKDFNVDMFEGFYINKYGISNYKDKFNRYSGIGRPIIPKTGKFFMFVNNIMLQQFVLNAKYDIYHPTYYNNYSFANSSKCVMTVHDMIHELFCDHFAQDKTSIAKKTLLSKADGIISVSENTKDDLINLFGINEEKIKVIYLANSLKLKFSEKKEFQEPYLLYVGSRAGYKNFDGFINASSQSKFKNDLNIVCFGGGKLTKAEQEKLHKLGLSEKVFQIAGNDELLVNLYHYAEAFIYPSLYEGFGIPPLEAMYYGTPVIASNASSIPEVVGAAGIYFNPSDYEEIQQKIDNVLNDTSLKNSLIEKGYMQEKLFSWEKCAKETFDFYREILLR